MEVIPAVDVLDGRVVRLARGNYDAATVYESRPGSVVARWAGLGASIVHVVDLEGARSGRPSPDLLARLADVDASFQIGGGLRTAQLCSRAVASGASRVVVGTAATSSGGALEDIVDAVGGERVVVAIDVADGKARGSGWLDEGIELPAMIDRVRSSGAARALVTGIERDGMGQGPDVELITTVGRALQPVEVIASGGVGSLDDLRTLATAGIGSAIVGRSLYEGTFTLPEAIEAATAPGL